MVQARPLRRAPDSLPPPWFLRTRGRVLAGLLLLFGGALLAGSLVTTQLFRRGTVEQVRRTNRVGVQLAALAIDRHVQSLSAIVQSYAWRPTLSTGVARHRLAGARRQLDEMVAAGIGFDRAFISDPRGRLLTDSPSIAEVHGRDFSYRDWYRGVSSGQGVYVSEIYRRAARPMRTVLAIAAPISDAAGAVVGYLVAQHTIADIVAENRRLSKQAAPARIELVSRHDSLVLDMMESGELPSLAGNDVIARLRRGETLAAPVPDPVDGTPSYIDAAIVPATSWLLLAAQPQADVEASLRRIGETLAALAVAVFLISAVFSLAGVASLHRYGDALADGERNKEMMISTLVHDMRAPLSAALATVDMMAADAEHSSDAFSREHLQELRRAHRRLLDLIATILDVNRIRDGKMPLRRVDCDIGTIVGRCVTRAAPIARAGNVKLTAAEPNPVRLSLDVDLFERLVDNLLTNAIKHTPSGGTAAVRIAPGGGGLRLSVHDGGPGIADEVAAQLFQPYGTPARGRWDSGLGLYFCRLVAEQHGGTIRGESAAQGGAVFTVEIPEST